MLWSIDFTIGCAVADNNVSHFAVKIGNNLIRRWLLGDIALQLNNSWQWGLQYQNKTKPWYQFVDDIPLLPDTIWHRQTSCIVGPQFTIAWRSTATILASSPSFWFSLHDSDIGLSDVSQVLWSGSLYIQIELKWPHDTYTSFLLRTWDQLPGAAHRSTALVTPKVHQSNIKCQTTFAQIHTVYITWWDILLFPDSSRRWCSTFKKVEFFVDLHQLEGTASSPALLLGHAVVDIAFVFTGFSLPIAINWMLLILSSCITYVLLFHLVFIL